MMTEDKPAIHLTNLLIIMAERNMKAPGGKKREARHIKREIITMAKTTTEVETKSTTTTKTAATEITDGTIKTEIDLAKTRLTLITETIIQMIKKQKKELQATKKEHQHPKATYLIDF